MVLMDIAPMNALIPPYVTTLLHVERHTTSRAVGSLHKHKLLYRRHIQT